MLTRHFTYDAAAEGGATQRYVWGVFALLFALMIVNHLDRQIVVSMLPRLKAVWVLSDTQLGGLVSIVSIAVALGVVPLSLLADRWGHVKSIFLAALVWSLATVACAFAGSYGQLLAARSVIGLGEAAYGSAGAALVASLFPPRVRSTMLGVFLAAAVVGSLLGVMLGGIIAERWGWRAAFGVAGIPGLVLAILFVAVARDPEPARDAKRARCTPSAGDFVLHLLRTRTVLVTCIGAGLQLLVVAATYAWLPSYLNRYYGLPADLAGIKTGLIVLIGGLGAVLWSIVADRLTGRFAGARLYVPAVAAIMTAVLLCVTFARTTPGEFQFWLMAAAGLVMTGSVGPVAAVIVDVSHPAMRATAMSILALIQNLIGLAGGPLLAGVLADRYGLRFAMSVVPAFSLLAAIVLLVASRTYVEDMRRVEGSPTASGLAPQAT